MNSIVEVARLVQQKKGIIYKVSGTIIIMNISVYVYEYVCIACNMFYTIPENFEWA